MRSTRSTLLQRLTRQRVLNWMSESTRGAVDFSDHSGEVRLGAPTKGQDRIRASWTIDDNAVYSRLATGGSIGLAESYLRGQWHTDDLPALLRILYRNQREGSRVPSFAETMSQWFLRLVQRVQGNTLDGSRKHIAAHYDLSNEFFELFLDPTLMYSSAFFQREDMSLYDASIAKLAQICRKLDLQANDEVLEIGTGWGGFALHAVTQHDIQLTTTTISAAQLQRARQRFDEAGITDRVNLLDTDYRQLQGQYDKLVSIEMVEAVGERYLENYFRRCGSLLRPGGRFVLQAIVMPEQRYDSYRRNVDFIQKYIFPGGFLPSITAMQQAVGRTSDLRLAAMEDLSPHYARTLREWRRQFMNRLADVRQLGFDERFIRMWEYYLCYCEAAFLEQAVRVVQIVWDKPTR